MTNPMTPTEQDKELQNRVDAIVLTFLLSDRKKVYANDLTYNLMQLITADRKRVALEARLDELGMMNHTNLVAASTVPRVSKDNRNPVRRMSDHISDRIAELKAQQEEVE